MATMTFLISCLLFLVTVRGEPKSDDSDVIFRNGDELECNRLRQCAWRRITRYDYVYCSGLKACQSSTIRVQEELNCYGKASCDNADIASDYEIRCDGEDACDSAIVEAGEVIYCGGSDGCQVAKKLEAPTIYCSGEFSCVEIESGVIITDSLYCTGDNGCHDSTITNVATITATGYQALRSAIITATDGNSVTVYAYGYSVADYLTLACESGSSCVVYCSEDDISGCDRITNKCDSGAKCSISYTSSSALKELIDKQHEIDAKRIEKRRKEINANRMDTVAGNNKHVSENHRKNDWLSQMVQKLQNMETRKIDFLLLVIGLSILFFGIGFYLAYSLYKNYKTCENNEYQLIN